MLKNYLKISLRNIFKSKIFSFINITGLAIGMAGTLLILMYVLNELSYENFHQNRDRIYRIAVDFGQGESKMHLAGAMEALGPAIAEKLPEVENAVRFKRRTHAVLEYENKEFQEPEIFFTDPCVFDVFSFTLRKGLKDDVLQKPYDVVITEQIAQKYFGNADPVGKTLLYNKKYPLKISGIIKNIPANTHLRCEFLVSYKTVESIEGKNEYPWTSAGGVYTYALLQPNTSLENFKESLNQLLTQNTNPNFANIMTFRLQNVSDIYLDTSAIVDIGAKGNMNFVIIFSLIAIFVLLIACFNFINMSTAQSLKRLQEVGIRKVLGATRFQLFKQFLGESFIITIISIIIGFIFFYYFYPKFNTFLENSISAGEQNYFYLLIMVPIIVLFVGAFSGIISALFLARFRSIDVTLKQQTPQSRSSRLRKGLVILQYALSVFLIIATLTVYQQINFMKNTDLGFNKKNTLLIYHNTRTQTGRSNYTALKNRWQQDPRVLSVSGAYTVPGMRNKETKIIKHFSNSGEQELTIRSIAVDYNYVKTMGLEIIKGRDFSGQFSSDQTQSIILNQAAVKKLNISDPLNKKIRIPISKEMREMKIIGVIRDFHVTTLEQEIEPIMLYINPDFFYTIAIHIAPENVQETIENLKTTWNSIMQDTPFEYKLLKNVYDELYVSEEKISQMLNIFAGLGIFIACLGLFGLVSFSIETRKKEIGIRKVLGASVSGVTLQLTKDFTLLVILSNIIAWPVTWFVMREWLNNYAYRIDMNFLIFLGAGLLTFCIALATISYQSIKAATTNPVDSLRYE